MKRWLRNKLLRFLQEPTETETDYGGVYPSAKRRGSNVVGIGGKSSGYISDSTTPETSPILNFRIYGATGGWVIEFSKLDRQGDRVGHSVNVVADHESFLQDVNAIIQMELLRV